MGLVPDLKISKNCSKTRNGFRMLAKAFLETVMCQDDFAVWNLEPYADFFFEAFLTIQKGWKFQLWDSTAVVLNATSVIRIMTQQFLLCNGV